MYPITLQNFLTKKNIYFNDQTVPIIMNDMKVRFGCLKIKTFFRILLFFKKKKKINFLFFQREIWKKVRKEITREKCLGLWQQNLIQQRVERQFSVQRNVGHTKVGHPHHLNCLLSDSYAQNSPIPLHVAFVPFVTIPYKNWTEI